MRNNKLTIIKISIISVILMFLEIKNTYASFNVKSITTEISDRRIYIIKYITYSTYFCISLINIFSNRNINKIK